MTITHPTPVDIELTSVDPKKCIQLVRVIYTSKFLDVDQVAHVTSANPNDWNHLRLVIKGNIDEFDTIAAWDENTDCSAALYLGHWNDGVVA